MVLYDNQEGRVEVVGGGPKRAGMYVPLGLTHTIIQQKLTLYYKAIILQPNNSYDKPQELPRWHSGKESAFEFRRCKKHGLDPWVGKIPWKRKWQPTAVFLPG